jgi:hypothetical protein
VCEYCGCQSPTAIDELTREHDRGVRLISHLRPAHQDGDVDRMARVAREIATVLGPHTQAEDPAALARLATEQWEAVEAERTKAGGAPSRPTA